MPMLNSTHLKISIQKKLFFILLLCSFFSGFYCPVSAHVPGGNLAGLSYSLPTPIAHFTINQVNQCIDTNIFVFTNASTIGAGSAIVSRKWDFGDGKTSTEMNPIHTYKASGNYRVVLKVTTDKGLTASVMRNVTVMAVPTAAIKYANTAYCQRGSALVIQKGQKGGTYSSDPNLVINATTGEINLALSATGTHTVTYTFSNGACTSTATTTVLINKITLPTNLPDITEQFQATPVAPVLTDVCSGTITARTSTNFPITTKGISTVVWAFDYGSGYTRTVSQNVIIDNAKAPNVPVLSSITGQCSVTPPIPTTTDASGRIISGTTATSFPITAQGTTVVIWKFDDGRGNVAVAIQDVIVKDTTGPKFVEDLPGNLGFECTEAVPTAPILTAIDNCSEAKVTYEEIKVERGCGGNYQLRRIWTATDLYGNKTIHTQIIRVNNSKPPVFNETLPPLTIDTNCDEIPIAPVLTATDNCGKATVSFTENKITDTDCSSKYILQRSWIASDECGNQNIFRQTVNVSCLPKVHNGFSPNGDGRNDSFVIHGIECYPDNKVQVHNRYGVLIYEKTGYDNVTDPFRGFSDGRATIGKGEKLPTGTYFYTLMYNNNGDKVVKSGFLYMRSN